MNQASLSSTGLNDAVMNSKTTPQFPLSKVQCCQLLALLENSPWSNQPTTMNVTSNSYFVGSLFSFFGYKFNF